MGLIEKIRERRKYAFEHPIKSGSLIGEIFFTCLCSLAFGIVLSDSLSRQIYWGYGLSVLILALIVINSYFEIYKPVKRLENELYKN